MTTEMPVIILTSAESCKEQRNTGGSLYQRLLEYST
jgi:hypothetical protein